MYFWTKNRASAAALCLALLSSPVPGNRLFAQQPGTSPLTWSADGFQLNGKPFRIISGDMDYARIPRADWRDRLRKAHAMGLNTITSYVFWNLHEPQPGVYDFEGQNDVREFLREAQQEGLYVVLRPGPYVCAEWDLGGYPAWLLKDHSMILRSLQPQFMAPVTRWMLRLGQELAPLQAGRGGPILAVQVENEYGSFGDDHLYLDRMLELVRRAGFNESLLYTADGADVLDKGSLPSLLNAIDFGTGDAGRSIALFRKQRPHMPLYVAEYWDGWFDHWGEPHQTTDAAKQEDELRTMLADGASVNIYMVHGGTTFGWMNGANVSDNRYQPDVSSYDYDAPLDESGRPRPKYYAFRDIIANATHTVPPPVPESPPLLNLPRVSLQESQSLWDNLPSPITSTQPLSMEDLGQNFGYILYRTSSAGEGTGELAFHDLHSYARIYVNSKLQGVVDRRLGQGSLPLSLKKGDQLDVLVENSGRVNFTMALRGERAGLTGPVTFAGRPVEGWQIYPLPLQEAPHTGYHAQVFSGPSFYRAEMHLDKPGDTFLNVQNLSKGVLWVNGHLLGRFWDVGPTGSLFLPGAWLRAGRNEIVVFDLEGGAGRGVEGQDHPTYFLPRAQAGPVREPSHDDAK